MYIYSHQITPRLQYIVNTLFAGIECKLTTSSAEFHEYTGPKINYSTKRFSDAEFLICPAGLLFQKHISEQRISCSVWQGYKIFFQTRGDVPFDILSASFYLLSRYEEYLPHKKDSYGRFAHEESLAFKERFLQLPMINLWQQQLWKLLEEKFSDFQLPVNQFSFQPTYDIDIAFAHKGKSWYRKLISKLKNESFSTNGKDAFDVYDWLDDLHEYYQLSPAYFFLVAQRRSMYDKNLSPRSKVLRQLIRKVSGKYRVGLHPSWQSYSDESQLTKELVTLQEIAAKKVNISRQHYIQFTLPYSFRCLLDAEITEDYSLGYGSINGFRASYCYSFYWYDLMQEAQTSLQLHPFCFMEANSYFEQKLSAEEAEKELQHYYDIVKQVNGNLITIFHNHFLTAQPQWLPWRKMYENFLHKNSL